VAAEAALKLPYVGPEENWSREYSTVRLTTRCRLESSECMRKLLILGLTCIQQKKIIGGERRASCIIELAIDQEAERGGRQSLPVHPTVQDES
jgi:hypothetical protein